MERKRPKSPEKPGQSILWLSIKNELYEMKLSLALALAPVAAFVAPVLLRVENTTKNGALTAIFGALEVQTPNSCSTAPTRAVALRFLSPPHAAATAHGWR